MDSHNHLRQRAHAPKHLTAVALVATAATSVLLAGCGSSGAATDTASAERVAAAAPSFPVWTCEDFGSEDRATLTVVNQSSVQVTLRAPKPADCAPWSGTMTPGQVNAEGAIAPGESRTVALAYDGLTDVSGTTQRTRLGIEVYLSSTKSAWAGASPTMEFIRSTDQSGKYIWRKINLFVPATTPGVEAGRYECSTTIALPRIGGVAHQGAFQCAGLTDPSATLSVRDLR